MSGIPPSELVLNADGSIYHLGLHPEQVAPLIIGVGDPDRVAQVSQHFDAVEFKTQKREFVTHTGRVGNRRLTVISTGIGTDNVEIVLTELDALVNVDLQSRMPHPERKPLSIVRLGTSGGLQEDIAVGDQLATNYAVGLDNLMQFYDLEQTPKESELAEGIQAQAGLAFLPYCVRGSKALLYAFGGDLVVGGTLTAPGFYAPQGRSVVLSSRYPDLLEDLRHFQRDSFRLNNFEMETAAYYALSRLMGHKALNLNVILANRVTGKFASNPNKLIDKMIVDFLGRLSAA